MRLISLLLLTLVVCLASGATAQTLSFNESEAKLNFRSESAEISFAIENPRGGKHARLKLELIAPNEQIANQIERDVFLGKGRNDFSVPLEIASPPQDFAFYRLRYQVSAENETASGIVAVSEIAPEVFELEVASAGFARENRRYFSRVRAVQPVSLRPVENVKISGEFKIESRDNQPPISIKSEAVTDSNGDAALEFQIPSSFAGIDETRLKITGEKNNFLREAANQIQFNNSLFAYLQTDKPLYQPGQMLRVRTLFLTQSNRAVPDADLIFVVRDPENQVLQKVSAKTSRFGVASFEWQVPENSKLGEYQIVVESERDLASDRTFFKVSRYDLPNFVVNAKPDRQFYLPENAAAEIEIRADYLFGQPVAKGKARVVREFEREWNYKEQKYDTREGATVEGELDAEGKFVARFDLAKEHADFEVSRWQRFKDLRFAAYITDFSTNKTEQRRFDVRLTKEEIHVRLIGETDNLSRSLPAKFYVSAFYADGTPADCNVEIHERTDESQNNRPILRKLLARAKTNRFGAGKVYLPVDFTDKDENDPDIFVEARDRNGKTGTTEMELDLENGEPVIQLETDKTVYKPGERVKISIRSSEPNAQLFLDVVREGEVIRAERVRLKRGRADIRLPYNADFRAALTFAAYAELLDPKGNAEIYVGQKTVIFPKKHGLQIEARTSAETLKPGAEAAVEFSSTGADGAPAETALGIVILDKAIEERARTDSEFGGRSRDFYGDLRGIFGFNEGFGGLTRFHLNNLDLKQKFPADLQLAAEMILRDYYRPEIFRSREFRSELETAYQPFFYRQFETARNALYKTFNQRGESPADETDLRRILIRSEIDFGALRDAWGTAYKTEFSVSRERRTLVVKSAGADKKHDTGDDLTALRTEFNYFQPLGWKINGAVVEYNRRNGNFIRDYKTLREELLRRDVDLDSVRDAFGKPYRFDFGVEGVNYTIRVRSAGEDGKFDKTEREWESDDFVIWTNSTDYFAVTRAAITKAVSDYVREKQHFPSDEAELKAILKTLKFDLDNYKDVYGRQFYVSRRKFSRNADAVKIQTYGESKTEIKPIAQEVVTFSVKSTGADGKRDSSDDYELTSFTGVVSEQPKTDSEPKETIRQIVTTETAGAIQGTIVDPTGAVIPGVKVRAAKNPSGEIFEATSNEDGFYSLTNLPSGFYNLTFEGVAGFNRTVIQNVGLQSANVTELDVALEIGTASSMVEVTVTSDAVAIDTIQSRLLTTVSSRGFSVDGASGSENAFITDGQEVTNFRSGTLNKSNKVGAEKNNTNQQIETPRLREYFPETLVWQPELITDKNGRAELKFKLADSLTTWKIAVVGSTVDGEIGIAEREIKAFQPFFAEHDPPKILTEGDKIALPVVLRNYLNQPQNVRAMIDENSWFRLLGAAEQNISVAPNSSNNAIFDFEAVASVKNGKQRVTAIASDASDAIEKTVSVHPHGREIAKTQGAVFREQAEFDVSFPADALPRTQRAELKIYPNLMSHVVESIEGILQRPYGCGEQTISSTYPSLLVLKAAGNDADTALKTKARKYLQIGYDRLLGYKSASGGFTYWGRGEADLALTAYALRFLTDAQDFVAVDENLIRETGDWLLKQQTANGSFRNDAKLTAFAARILARVKRDEKSNAALKNALEFLRKESLRINEPYVLAQLALASFDAGDAKTGWQIADKLKTLAKSEGGAAFWNLETGTPFNGWGGAGRIETTALVLQVLVKAEGVSRKGAKTQSKDDEQKNQKLISGGLQFLLKEKDRYGVWYSTQTTINVLDTLIALVGKNENRAGEVEILVNRTKAGELDLPAGNESNNLLTFDLTPFVSGANNSIEIRQTGNIATASAQIVQNYYVPWRDENNSRANNSNNLRLSVNYDKTSARIGEEITCRVETERTGYLAYGMILAEIGLPPGADLQRESLQRAMETDWNFSRYDVLPDRIIVYLWSKPGGNKFEFKFKQRYGIEAVTAPSIAYDYYNPEAQATLAPTRFSVR